jgi:hypothetical protein
MAGKTPIEYDGIWCPNCSKFLLQKPGRMLENFTITGTVIKIWGVDK